jgi:hypothetical protein
LKHLDQRAGLLRGEQSESSSHFGALKPLLLGDWVATEPMSESSRCGALKLLSEQVDQPPDGEKPTSESSSRFGALKRQEGAGLNVGDAVRHNRLRASVR